MSTTLDFDADLARRVESVYATPDVAATRIAVFRAAEPRRGERALDVGCGPGYLTRELACAVGPTGQAVGVDLSEPMLALARQRCGGASHVRLLAGDAARLPLEDACIDVACGLQVYAYVRELDVALAELRRALRPDGRAVILDTDFSGVVWHSRDPARMQRVMRAFDAHCAWPDLPRALLPRLRDSGFELVRGEVVPILSLAYHPNTYVHGLARFIHRFVIDKAGLAPEEADAWLAEHDALEAERSFLYSVNRFVFTLRRR